LFLHWGSVFKAHGVQPLLQCVLKVKFSKFQDVSFIIMMSGVLQIIALLQKVLLLA